MDKNQEINPKFNMHILSRLLRYAKPYRVQIGIALILLLSVVGVELARPLVIGRAVDNIINQYNKVYTIVEEPTEESTAIQGLNIILGEYSERYGTMVYQLDSDNQGHYFFVPDITKEMIKQIETYPIVKGDDNQYRLIHETKKILLIPLTDEDILVLRNQDLMALVQLSSIFVGLLLLGLLLSYAQTMMLNRVGQKTVYGIRSQLVAHVNKLDLNFFGQEPVGKLVTRITNDTESLNELYANVIVDSVKSVVVLIGILIMMFSLSWKLTIMILLISPLIIGITMLFGKTSIKVYSEVRTRLAQINVFLSEHISGMKIVQIFGQEKRKFEEFNAENQAFYKSGMKQLHMFGVFRPAIYFLYVLALFIVLLYGSSQVLHNTITIGTLIIFIQYIGNFFDPIQHLAEQFDTIQSSVASAEKIFTLLDTKAAIQDKQDGIALEQVIGKIEFKNVWFAYNEEDWILRDVSFVVNAGETAAFVGATGAGKSSILNLIMRYYDIQKGQILIDDIDLKEIKISSLRKQVGQMLQDVFLFTGTINSNIRLRDTGISDQEIIEAAEYVNADRFIKKLPRKYDEPVYEGGATYSTGERQLLSFARTLVTKPNILILDEATANIDTETEQLIQDALIKIMNGRTTLVVAHRLSTIQHADKIIVLHKGRIKEMGNHQTLLNQQGHYYQLYQLQYSSQEQR